jgi:TolB protein
VGQLVFCKRRRGEAGTYLANAEGKNLQRIMFLCGAEIAPRFAPDGKCLAFSSLKAGKPIVWIANREGGERQEVCAGDQPTWSPDGSRIFFRRAGQIVERSVADGKERIVSPPKWKACAFPDCSPDGQRLLFAAEVEGRAQLFVTAVGSQAPQPLADLGVVSPARWSPEGRRIAYADDTRIMVMAADGSWRYRLTTGGGLHRYPAWSGDGTMLAYCHSPLINGGWMLCVAKADGTQTRVLPKEDDVVSFFAPDWHPGTVRPAESAAGIRPAPRVSVWDAAGLPILDPARRDEWPQQRSGRKPVLGGRVFENGVILENERIVLVLQSKASSVRLWPKPLTTQTPALELIPVSERGEAAGRVVSVSLTRNDGEEAVVELSTAAPGGPAVRTSWRMCGNGPLVQVSPVENAGSLRIHTALKRVVVPDRFANDLLCEPALSAGTRIALPSAPMVLGFGGSGDTVLELASPAEGQAIDLLKDAGPATCFSGAEVRFAKTSVILGVLTGQTLWYEERPNVKYERKRLDLNWEMPGPGAWRLAVRVDGKSYSETFLEKESPRFDGKKLFLTPQEDFAGRVDLALVYLYGRSPGIALDRWTPTDIALDGLGLASYRRAFDIDGLLSYRTASRQTTWADVFGTLRSLEHLYSRGAEKAERTFAEHLCDEIPAFFEGMDGRLGAFVAFRREVAQQTRVLEGTPPTGAAFLAAIKPALDRLDDACQKREKLPALAEAAGYAAQIKELTPQDMKDTAEKRRKFSTSNEKLSRAAQARADVIRVFRSAAVQLRDLAGMACTEHPQLRDAATKLRQSAQEVLRNRYYFEADWHGEVYRVAPFWLGPRPY